jgi:hypothetical protein
MVLGLVVSVVVLWGYGLGTPITHAILVTNRVNKDTAKAPRAPRSTQASEV